MVLVAAGRIDKEDSGIVASQVSAPVSTTVIAIDLAGAEAFGAAVLAAFAQVVDAARALGFVTQEPGRPNLTLTLAPELEAGAILGRIARSTVSFDAVAAPVRCRLMAHYGVVFRTEGVGEVSYVGSAIRSTQSALRRAPASGSLMATPDFAAYAGKLAGLPFKLQPLSGGSAADGLVQMVFPGINAAAGGSAVLPSADAAFVEFVKRRLAADIGPFAAALVDRAIRATAAAEQLVPALSRDIDDPAARSRFEADVLSFIKSQTR